ncbi:helicase [[Clostridium] sordellii]|uniref:type I restriction endonuclease subunit R n=1 Tax=Paraclostridium sordellii TaxID=1505 RepID=UPI0005DC02A5|nr:type I restriction endonuclease [Paeniclostridium sordellii]CEO35434.1 helicase [[Clostridium] sordellii] [Paeniclostridium sordellii]CEP92801.1 helicase [[Clostridium] sordellii] [Paeniclostridium sordellii]
MINNNMLKERKFQTLIKEYLIDNNGYIEGFNKDYNKDLAMDTKLLFDFLESTQPKEIEKLKEVYQDKYKTKIIERLNKEIQRRGIIDVIKNGTKDRGTSLKFAFFKPPSTLNKDLIDLYNKNIISVTEELNYNSNYDRVDVVIFLNGLPIIAIELKKPLNGQTYKHAISQFKTDRDPKNQLFKFKERAIVCFAMDTEEAHMATKLDGDKTFFLPFNKGNKNGKGNPVVEDKVRTHYMWEEVFTKDSLLEIIHKFVYISIEEIKDDSGEVIGKKEKVIFPRYHQLDVIRKVLEDVKANKAGQKYLIQHSAGSGKTNSISWLSHRLATVYDENDNAIFNGVIVVTDRKVLDAQLQKSIVQLQHAKGFIAAIDDNSTQLASELNKGTKIIITTIQKFPYILDKLKTLSDKNFAIVIDEAHSSTSGRNMGALTQSLTLEEAQKLDEDLEGEKDIEDKIIDEIKSQGIQDNISFFAFTATPKGSTLKMFGRKDKKGNEREFHLYSMKQAIQEGFILDVLKKYTTYRTYYRVSKKIQDDPEFEKAKATKAIARFVSLHPHNIDQKTEVMIEHFRNITKHKINGSAKAMVVTSSRLHAVRYKMAFDKYIKENGYKDINVLVAFSGTVNCDGEEYTEAGMNGFAETQLPTKFNSDDYQILLVAEKYQTGFDQPKLHTMFVDKKLSGVKAVQTLSRLNRTCPGKEDTFVLDFVNDTEDIRKSFEPYYESTELDGDIDPNELYTLSDAIYDYNVIDNEDVEKLVKVMYKEKHTKRDINLVNSYLDNTINKIDKFDKNEKSEFRGRCRKFINLYTFILQITHFEDTDLHKLYLYLWYLVKKINIEGSGPIDLNDKVALQYYSLRHEDDSTIKLGEEEEAYVTVSISGGAKKEEEKDSLSDIIQKLNDKYETDFGEHEKLAVDQIVNDMKLDNELILQAKNNTESDFRLGYYNAFEQSVVNSFEKNQEFYGRILEDDNFKDTVMEYMLSKVYSELKNITI